MSAKKKKYKLYVPKSRHLVRAYVPFNLENESDFVSFDENGTALIIATKEQAMWFENHGYVVAPVD